MKLWVLVPIPAISIVISGQDAPNSDTHFVLEKNVPVRMRDGVVLRADVMRPPEADKFPVLVYRTPYGKDAAQQQYTTFKHGVERGYAVVIQDVRGRHQSDGDFRPYENEGQDGYDTIEWAAAQPWSNGNVGTFGLSYPGAVQWLAAVQNPPHLRAMVPAMTFSTPRNFFYAGGTWDMSWIDWIWDNIAWDTRAKKNLPGPRTYREALAASEHEQRIRKLIQLIVSERDPAVLSMLASELERLLKLEEAQLRHSGGRPWVGSLWRERAETLRAWKRTIFAHLRERLTENVRREHTRSITIGAVRPALRL